MSLAKFTYIKELYRFIPDSFITGEETDLSVDDVLENGAELRFYNEDENELNIESIKTLLDSVMNNGTEKTDSDFILSPQIHRLFKDAGMNRKLAANAAIWDFLTVFYFNDFVKWRWTARPVAKNRFMGNDTKRNSLSRLWWWAEITHDPNRDDPYELTKRKTVQNTIQFTLDTRLPNNKDIIPVLLQYIVENDLSSDNVATFFVRARILNATRKCVIMDEETLNQFLEELMT